MVESTYRVPDVSCEHCVKAVTEELGKVDGIKEVTVDLESKLVTVRHEDKVNNDLIIEALDEAGYSVAT